MKKIKIKDLITRITKFLGFELWKVDLKSKTAVERSLIKLLRILDLAVKSFKEDKLNVRASALTYFSLLSIVPVLALGFGIAKGFGLDEVLEKEIIKNFDSQKEVMQYMLSFTRSMLDSAKGGVVAGVGLALLLWSVMKLMMNIESAFNSIWDVTKARTYARKFTDYFAIMLIAPLFIILSSSTSVFLASHISSTNNSSLFSIVVPWVGKIANLFPYIIVWLLFTIIYMVMPNTKVNFKSAIIGGIIAGSMFQAFQNLYILFQTNATRTSAIYGSFAALPLFLIWLQISWFVVLLGCEISYAVQSVRVKGSAERDKHLSTSYLKNMAVFLMKIIINEFVNGKKAPTLTEIADDVKLPQHTVQIVLDRLVKAGALSRVLLDKQEKIGYQPAKNIDDFDIVHVIELFENHGEDLSSLIEHEDFKLINKQIDTLNLNMKMSELNLSLKNLK